MIARLAAALLLSSGLAAAEPSWKQPPRVYLDGVEVCSRDRRGQWHAVDDDWQRCVEALVRNMEQQFRLVAKLIAIGGKR
jgi:hypothetical protein